jgi:hypothetical protein
MAQRQNVLQHGQQLSITSATQMITELISDLQIQGNSLVLTTSSNCIYHGWQLCCTLVLTWHFVVDPSSSSSSSSSQKLMGHTTYRK